MARPVRVKFCFTLRMLAASVIFIILSVESSSGLECNWCGPLADQVHRSRRAPPCHAGLLNSSLCEYPHGYCAFVASSPPYAESRICVKVHQEACYSLFCNTSKQLKIVCTCLGDRCNGEKTEREIRAFRALTQASETQYRQKRENQKNNQLIFRLKIVNPDEPSNTNNVPVEQHNKEENNNTRKMIQITFEAAAKNNSESNSSTTPQSMIDVDIIHPSTKVYLVHKEAEVQIDHSTTDLNETMQIPKPTPMTCESTVPTLPPSETTVNDPAQVITTEKRLSTTEEISSTTATTVVNITNERPVEPSEVAYNQHIPTIEQDKPQQISQNNTEKIEENGTNDKNLSESPKKDVPELSTEKAQQFNPQTNIDTPQKDAPAMDSTEEMQNKFSPLPTMDITLPKVTVDTMRQTFETPPKPTESATIPSVNKNIISTTPLTLKNIKNTATKNNSIIFPFFYCIIVSMLMK